MTILFISDSFYPDTRSSALITYTLIESISKKNIKTKLITSSEENIKVNINKCDIHNLKLGKYRDGNFIIRGFISFLHLFKYFSILNKKGFLDDVKLVYFYYPSFFLSLLSIFIKFKKIKTIIHMQDFFPDNAKDLGILKNIIIFKIFKFLQRFIIKINDYIVVNSKKSSLLLKKNHQNKFYFFHNWSLNKLFLPRPLKKFKKFSKFTFIYSGTIGPAQDLELLLSNFISIKSFEFNLIIIGSGRDHNYLKKKYSKFKFIIIKKALDPKSLYKFYVRSHCSIISLSLKNNTSFIPSKFYEYVDYHLPIFSIAHKNTDIHDLINSNNIGFSSSSISKQQFNKNINIFYKNYSIYRKNISKNPYSNNLNIFTDFILKIYAN